MSEEQMLYIGPEDDLTFVRERLEQIPTRHVVLVVPSTTQLRSHVAWKLLHARARELAKDVLIVSSDPQIRSVAQGVKFRVASTLESSQLGKSRPAARPRRNNIGGRGRIPLSSSQRMPPNRDIVEAHRAESALSRRPTSSEQSLVQQDPARKIYRDDEDSAEGMSKIAASSSDALEKQYEAPHDLSTSNISSPTRPPIQQMRDEEPDLLEDFLLVREIREAAIQGSSSTRPPQTSRQQPELPIVNEPVLPSKIVPQPDTYSNPFRHMKNEASTERASKTSASSFDVLEKQQIDEEPDLFPEDFDLTRQFRQSVALTNNEGTSQRTWHVFFCYAREDESFLNQLKVHLTVLQRQKLIDTWHDRNISAGTEWEQEIDKYLNKADIILLLVSPDFIASDYCYGVELKRAMERHECGEARVIPVILRPVFWQRTSFGKLQALPTDAKPITSWSEYSRDEAFFAVAEGIRKAVEELEKLQ